MNFCVRWMLFVACLTLGEAIFAQQLAPEVAAQVDQAVKAEMKKQDLVGVSIGIVEDGEIVYLQGYGWANRETQVPVTSDTVINWASNSKPMAGFAAMRLVECNRLNLDADVRCYVPEFPVKSAVITTRQLLCHQSGIPHYENGKVLGTERTYPCERPFLNPILALDTFNQSPLIFQPGTKHEYSTYAFILLSAVIQRASGRDFTQYICENIAQPLNMLSFQLDFETNGQLHWAKGYTKNAVGQVIEAPESAHYWKHAGGGFKSNVRDFARWARALTRREILAQSSYNHMWTDQKTSDGKATGRGLSFGVDHQPKLMVSHNGKQTETRTRLEIYPDERRGVVVMCNCGYAESSELTAAIQRVLMRK